MTKLVLDPMTSGASVAVINENFQKISDELQNKVLYRNNTSGEANSLSTDLDTNGKRVYNLPAPTSSNEAARLQDVTDAIASANTAVLTSFTPYGTISSDNVQGAIQEVVSDLASSGGSSLIGTILNAVGAVWRTVLDKFSDSISVFDFMTTAQKTSVKARDSVEDVTAAIQAAITHAKTVGGGKVFFPSGVYKITDAIIVDTGVYSMGLILEGCGRNTIISQTGVGKDAFHFSTTQYLQNSGIRDMKIVTSATAGHCINFVYGCTTCFISNCDFEQNNPAKSILYGDWSTFGGGVYDTKFSGGSWYCSGASTASGVRFIVNGTIFNENIFENLRCYNSKTAQFFKITTAVSSSIWLINNTWKNINFEICPGGGIAFDSFKNCKFDSISFWDASGNYTNHLIDMLTGVGYESVANTFTNVGRNGDGLDVGVNDIRIVSGQDTVLINCYTQNGDVPRYDLANKRVTVIGKLFGTINNSAGAVIMNPVDGIRFGGTVNGVSLNYYDEGTWTATLRGTTAAPTVPVTIPARYTRIGREVLAEGVFGDVSLVGATGTLQITGLPFTCGSGAVGSSALLGLGSLPPISLVPSGATTITIADATSLGGIAVVAAANKYVYFSIKYTV